MRERERERVREKKTRTGHNKNIWQIKKIISSVYILTRLIKLFSKIAYFSSRLVFGLTRSTYFSSRSRLGSKNPCLAHRYNIPRNRGTFPESLDPLRGFGTHFRYPLPWIFNPCASMVSSIPPSKIMARLNCITYC